MCESFERYLNLLGIPKELPTLEYLEKITKEQMIKIPFENISKLFYFLKFGLRDIPSFEQYLDGIEKFHFGGTCYSNNFYLYKLLQYLGFDVSLCGADMKQPDVHIVNFVKIEGREFIVDVGNAAPFISPLPRDLTIDYEICLGSNKYVLSPKDALDRSKMTMYRDGELLHGYLMKPEPRDIKEFSNIIRKSFIPEAVFMNALLAVRFGINSSIIISNMTLIETENKSVKKSQINNFEGLLYTIEEKFNIPTDISRIALKNLTMHKDAWG